MLLLDIVPCLIFFKVEFIGEMANKKDITVFKCFNMFIIFVRDAIRGNKVNLRILTPVLINPYLRPLLW